jgi:hypothetical protein
MMSLAGSCAGKVVTTTTADNILEDGEDGSHWEMGTDADLGSTTLANRGVDLHW